MTMTVLDKIKTNHIESRNVGHKSEYHVFYQMIDGVRCNVHTSKSRSYISGISERYK